MKRIFCFFVFLFIIVTQMDAQNKALRKYYYWVNQAELAICDSNYQKASDCYDKAFTFHRPFSRHAYFAIKVNRYYLNNMERSMSCFRFLAQMGEKPEWYADSLAEAYLFRQLKSIYDTTNCLVNTDLATSLREIEKSDQEIRWMEYEDEATAFAAYRDVDSINLLKIKELYKTYPEISDYTADGSPLLTAFYTHVSRSFLFDPSTILLKEVRKGNIAADQYAFNEDQWKCLCINPQLDNEEETIYGTNANCIFMIDSIVFFLQPEKVKKVDKERRKIGLSETWTDFIKKAEFVYTHETEFRFIPINNKWYPSEKASAEIEQWIKSIEKGERNGFYIVVPKELR